MMRMPCFLALIALTALTVSLRQSFSVEEPAKVKKRNDLRATLRFHNFLSAMKEPPLWKLAEKDNTATVYRFLWLPTFHSPISVRFVKSDAGVILHAVRLDGKGGYEPGNIIVRKSKKLMPAHWERIAKQIEKAKFWSLPTYPPPSGTLIADGDMLIVEGVNDGVHHAVVRHSPSDGDFVDLCRAMLFMSGIDVRKLWFDYR